MCPLFSFASKRSFTSHQNAPHVPHVLSQVSPSIVSYAKGSYIYTTTNRKLLDFICGIGVTNLGHCHPRVENAAIQQLRKGVHLQVNSITSEPLIKHSQKLKNFLPPHFQDYQVLYANSGAESIENAIKLARAALKRPNIFVFHGGFHGRTLAAGALTTAKEVYRSYFGPSISGVLTVPYSYCHRCPISRKNPNFCKVNCCNYPIDQLRLLLKQASAPDEIAAILVEPVLGEGGYVVPPLSFLQSLRKIADETGCLLIADEVQSGYGRCGEFWASNLFEFQPDLIVSAKGIANGLPLSMVVAREGLWSRLRVGSQGGTFGGNPVSLAAGIAVLDIFEEEKILSNVQERGDQLRRALMKLKEKYPISDVRGVGLMNAVEFSDSVNKGTAAKVSKVCEKNDLLLMTAGVYESLRFIPPLNITKDEMQEGIEKFGKSLKEVFG